MVKALLAHNLTRLRKKMGWTQSGVAERIGISLRYYQNMEKGVAWPSEKIITAATRAFNVDEYELFRTEKLERLFEGIRNETVPKIEDILNEAVVPYREAGILAKTIRENPTLKKIVALASQFSDIQLRMLLDLTEGIAKHENVTVSVPKKKA